MALELRELGDILDKASNPEAEMDAIRAAIQALMFHQIVYDDTNGISNDSFRVMRDNKVFFEKYFGTAGFKFVVDNRYQMFALLPQDLEKPPFGWQQNRLKKDETLVRLVLRHLFETGFRNGTMDDAGRVATTTLELTDLYQTMSKSNPPSDKNLTDVILKDLHRRGVIKLGQKDKESKVTRLTILPGIKILVSDHFVKNMEDWLEHAEAQQKPFLESAQKAPEPEAEVEDV